MAKKGKKSALDENEKLKYETDRDRIKEIFGKHPRDYIAKMEEIGFEYFEDDEDEEELEERKARPENQCQKDLVDYFEGRKELSERILDCYSQEKAAENPNYSLIRKSFKKPTRISDPFFSMAWRIFPVGSIFSLIYLSIMNTTMC